MVGSRCAFVIIPTRAWYILALFSSRLLASACDRAIGANFLLRTAKRKEVGGFGGIPGLRLGPGCGGLPSSTPTEL
uniref:Putative secreted protein n=1 Tax=Anopheles darlingi TaxID=43151 RepID=A0A2M4D101_ANODA